MRGRGALAEANALRLVGFARARVLVRSVTRARGSRASDGVERSSANDESSPPLGGDGKAPVWRKLAESAKESVFLRLLCVPRTPGSGIDLAVFAGRGRSWACTKVGASRSETDLSRIFVSQEFTANPHVKALEIPLQLSCLWEGYPHIVH